MDSPTQRRKSAVLLSEQQYLEKNIKDPCRYIPTFKGKGILTPEQCCHIKEQRSVEDQMQKFLELISMDGRSFTVFIKVLREQRVHGHVATHLKKKVSEMDRLSRQGEMLPTELQRVLSLVEFSYRAHMNHDLARDILSNVDWDLSRALEAAERMNYPQNTPDAANQDTDNQDANSAESSTRQEVKVHPEFGILPPQPPPLPSQDTQNLSSPITDVEDEFGTRPVPPPPVPVPAAEMTQSVYTKRTKMAANKSLSLEVKNSPHLYDQPVRSNTTPERSNPRQSCKHGSARQKTPHENISPSIVSSHERGPLTRNPLKKTPSIPGEKGRGDPKSPLANVSPSLHRSQEKRTPEHAPKRKLGATVVQNVPPPYVDPPQLSPPEEQQPRKLNSPLRQSPLSNSQPAVGNPRTVNLPLKGKSSSDLPSASPGTQTSSDATPYIMAISDDKAKEMMRVMGKPGVFFIRPSPAGKDTPHTLCLTTGRNYLKYHIVFDHLGFHIDTESSFDSLSELVEHYKKHPVKHSSDDKNSSDTKLTTPLSEYEPGDAMETRSKMFHLGSDWQLHQTQQPGGASKQGVQTPSTLSTKMPTLDSDLTRQHPAAGGASKELVNNEEPPTLPDLPAVPIITKPASPLYLHQKKTSKSNGNRPSLLELQMMIDAQGSEIRIIDEIAPRWDLVAIALEVKQCYINILERDFPKNAIQACYKMLWHWLENHGSQVSWGFLIDALRRADYKVLAKRIGEVKDIDVNSL